MKEKLSIVLPKGRLFEYTKNLFNNLDIDIIVPQGRKLYFSNDYYDFLYSRVSDVPVYVENGIDIGICGSDIVKENNSDVLIPVELPYGKCRMSLIVNKNSLVKSQDMEGYKIATKFPNITKSFFRSKDINIKTVKLNGAIELADKFKIADAIVDIVDTGKTLEQNDLKEIETIDEINSILIVNKISYKIKYKKIIDIINKLQEVLV